MTEKAAKKNALNNFIRHGLPKQDYVALIEKKISDLVVEKHSIKEKMTKNQAYAQVSVIKKQLMKLFNLNQLTQEIVIRFVNKIEVGENQNIKIFYNFSKGEEM